MSVLGEAIREFGKMGANRIAGKELKDLHGIYAYLMLMEEIKTGGPAGFTVDAQQFIGVGSYVDKDKLVFQRAMLTIAEVENFPIVAIVYGFFQPQIRMFHPDEVLTKHREDIKPIFGVVGIEFSINLGERLDSLEGLREKWLKLTMDWTERKREYHSKQIQKNPKGYLG